MTRAAHLLPVLCPVERVGTADLVTQLPFAIHGKANPEGGAGGRDGGQWTADRL